jgi:hypothetical protein
MEETFSDKFARLWTLIEQNFAQLLIDNGVDKRTRNRASLKGLVEIGAFSMGVSYEYNDSCNCHPEYQTDTLYLTWDTVEKMLSGEDWQTEIRAKTEARLALEKRQKEEAAQWAKEAQERELRKRELAELERLQAKYNI